MPLAGGSSLIVLAGVALALGVIVARLLVDARAAFRPGRRGRAAGRNRRRPSATTSTPAGCTSRAAPTPPRPSTGWTRIGVSAVTQGDYATARAAFEAERAAILGTRSFYTPHGGRLPDLERRLARLLAASEADTTAATFEERARWHASVSPSGRGPRRPWFCWLCSGSSPG